jgi:predicted DNA-binding transcriptional regulator AlpA
MTRMLNTKELAALLSCSPRHIYRHREVLRPAKVTLGEMLRWNPDKVLEVLMEQERYAEE